MTAIVNYPFLSSFIDIVNNQESRMKTGELKVRSYMKMMEQEPNNLNNTVGVNVSAEKKIKSKDLYS